MVNGALAAMGILANASPEASSFSNVTTGVSNMLSVVSTILASIVADPILCTLFVSGFIGIAIGIISKFKHA